MKFTVTIEGFWVEADVEEGCGGVDGEQIQDELKSYIISDVARQIKELMEGKIDKQITKVVEVLVESEYRNKIDEYTKDVIKNGMVKNNVRYANKNDPDKITLEEWIKNKFIKDVGDYVNIPKLLKENAEKHVLELKNRYDLVFASQVVAKINENGMLKDGIAKMILDKPKDSE